MKAFYRNFKLGIIGGGQLGRMLLQACPNFNLYTRVLDPSEDSPCKGLANEYVQGSLQDYATVYAFGKQVDLLTIEIENVNIDALYQLETEGIEIYPQPRVIEIIQDKSKQKEFYANNKIPTSSYLSCNGINEIKTLISRGDISFPFIWKASKMGYDGYGVNKISNTQDLEKLIDCHCI